MWTTCKEVCRWYVLLGSWEALLVESIRHSVETFRHLVEFCTPAAMTSYSFSLLLAVPRLFSACWSPQFSGWGKKEVGLLGNVLYGWRSWVLTTLSLTNWTNLGLMESLFTSFSSWRKGEVCKLKLFFLSSSMKLFSDFLCQWSVVALLLDPPATKMVLSFVSGCQNHFSVRNEHWKFLFHHLADITLLISFLL